MMLSISSSRSLTVEHKIFHKILYEINYCDFNTTLIPFYVNNSADLLIPELVPVITSTVVLFQCLLKVVLTYSRT